MDVLPRGKRPPADMARRPTGPLRLAGNLVVGAATIGTTRHRHVIPGDDRSRRGAGYNCGNSRPVPEMTLFPRDSRIEGYDPELAQAIADENRRQEDHVELIASENYASPRVMAAQGSPLPNKTPKATGKEQ